MLVNYIRKLIFILLFFSEVVMSTETSVYFKGFKVEKTNGGWTIINCPSRTKAGPVSPGPYSSIVVAENVINRIIAESY